MISGNTVNGAMDQEVIFVLCILYNNIFIALTFTLHYADKCAVVFVTITNARKNCLTSFAMSNEQCAEGITSGKN